MERRVPVAAEARRGHGWRWLACGIVIGGLAAWLVFARTDMAGVKALLLDDLHYGALAGALLAYAAFFVGKALRWRYLLRPLIEVPLSRLIAFVLIGYGGNVLLPMQAGEVARGYLISRHHGIKLAAALSGIAVEKVMDFVVLLAFLAGALWFVAVPAPLAREIAVLLAAVLSLVLLTLLAALVRPEATQAVVQRAAARSSLPLAGRLAALLCDGLKGVAALRHRGLLLKILVTSLLSWSAMLAALWLVLLSVAAGPSTVGPSMVGAIIVLFLSAVGLALPTSPGFVGTLQVAFVVGLVPLGVAQEVAVAASLVYQVLTTLLPLAAAGIAWAWLRNRAAR